MRDKNQAEYGREEKEKGRQEDCSRLGGSWGAGEKAWFRPYLAPVLALAPEGVSGWGGL